MCTYRSRSSSRGHSHSQIGRFQTADTVCLHTGEVHLKKGKVRELLLEIPSIRPDSVVLCVAIHSHGGVGGSYCMTFYGICGV